MDFSVKERTSEMAYRAVEICKTKQNGGKSLFIISKSPYITREKMLCERATCLYGAVQSRVQKRRERRDLIISGRVH